MEFFFVRLNMEQCFSRWLLLLYFCEKHACVASQYIICIDWIPSFVIYSLLELLQNTFLGNRSLIPDLIKQNYICVCFSIHQLLFSFGFFTHRMKLSKCFERKIRFSHLEKWVPDRLFKSISAKVKKYCHWPTLDRVYLLLDVAKKLPKDQYLLLPLKLEKSKKGRVFLYFTYWAETQTFFSTWFGVSCKNLPMSGAAQAEHDAAVEYQQQQQQWRSGLPRQRAVLW